MSSTLISSTFVPHFSGHNQRYSVCFVVIEAHCGFKCLSKGRTIPADPYPDTSETLLPLARCRAQRREALQHQRHGLFVADLAYPHASARPVYLVCKDGFPADSLYLSTSQSVRRMASPACRTVRANFSPARTRWADWSSTGPGWPLVPGYGALGRSSYLLVYRLTASQILPLSDTSVMAGFPVLSGSSSTR